jgi:hypothetical protein
MGELVVVTYPDINRAAEVSYNAEAAREGAPDRSGRRRICHQGG